MKIALVVPGRFHAFDLARELVARGHEVSLFTNYPVWAARKFGAPPGCITSFWLNGVLSRLCRWLFEKGWVRYPEGFLNRSLGKWAASRISKEEWDVVHVWSGVAEEAFRALNGKPTLKICHRSSSHIRVQSRLLAEEERRAGVPLERPSPWIVAREEREYAAADSVHVPSTFAKESFLSMGVPAAKLFLIPHGVRTEAFRPPVQVIDARCRRILSKQPIRVLNVGTFSFRKGIWDFRKIIQELAGQGFEFTFVGPVPREAEAVAAGLRGLAEFIPPQPQDRLKEFYREGDVFLLPTIEDGFPFVLAQASASGLPILTTPNGAGTDLVREGKSGWVLPARAPASFIERLRWCDSHRTELAEIVRQTYGHHAPRGWVQVAADLERFCLENLGRPVGPGEASK